MTTTLPDHTATTQPTASLPAAVRRIVLTGFMGSGKTTVGQLLAARLGWSFVDLDQFVEQRAGSTVPQLFAQGGEQAFRRLESTALAAALRQGATVLALGGGATESLTNRLLLEQTPGTVVVFLAAPFPTLFDRCTLQNVDRPVLADPLHAQARFTERQPFYRRLARHTVDTSALDPQGVLDTLLSALSAS